MELNYGPKMSEPITKALIIQFRRSIIVHNVYNAVPLNEQNPKNKSNTMNVPKWNSFAWAYPNVELHEENKNGT